MKEIDLKEIEKYFDALWPICRSITGDGLRESFRILSDLIPLKLTEVRTGTNVFDWTIPKEWNIKDAYIITPDGRKIANFSENNLHVVGYSTPINEEMSYEKLADHLYTLPRLPDAIPYITSYYKEKWGFCLSLNEFNALPKRGIYKVVIDSELKDGSLTYGDFVLKGDTENEILISSYLCHPSMANNELSGPLTLSFLYKLVAAMPNRKYSYRFILAPETIGTIAYLSNHKDELLKSVKGGFVLTCCGTNSPFVYKKSRQENSLTDIIAEHVLKHSSITHSIIDFDPIGSDERQYCSPGFNLAIGSLMRSKYHEYEEYHTSFDNKSLISFEALKETIEMYYKMIEAFELNHNYVNSVMFCEPNMGKRNLYGDLSGALVMPNQLANRMRLLNYMDGRNTLIEFCNRYNLSILDMKDEIELLLSKKVLGK